MVRKVRKEHQIGFIFRKIEEIGLFFFPIAERCVMWNHFNGKGVFHKSHLIFNYNYSSSITVIKYNFKSNIVSCQDML